MTIEQAGSIGELIAAIATVATLGYLAVQIRASAAATRQESRRAARAASRASNLAIAENGDVAELLNKGLADFDSLTPRESTQFQFLFSELLQTQLSMFEEPGDAETNIRNSFGHLLRAPGGRAYWERYADNYPADFRAHVEAEVLSPAARKDREN